LLEELLDDRGVLFVIRSEVPWTGCSFREASIILTGSDPGKNAKFSSHFVETLKTNWPESGAMISEQEIETLASRGIEP
jgi:hypothetical protein